MYSIGFNIEMSRSNIEALQKAKALALTTFYFCFVIVMLWLSVVVLFLDKGLNGTPNKTRGQQLTTRGKNY